MRKFTIIASVLFLVSCSPTTYYVVRHAEKDLTNTMSSDVPLSAQGTQRAEALKEELKNKNIRYIFSTNFIRTKSTAQPLSNQINVPIQTYNPADTGLTTRIKSLGKGNALIVGHSNTVDDVVNKLTGENHLQDLTESSYGDLFIIRKKGNKFSFERARFGQ